MSWSALIPYNELPPLPPAGELESHRILKACIEARVALAGVDGATDVLPNPSMLINTLPVLEAQASSEIENIVTTTDALFRYAQLDDRSADAATKEALRYRTALREGFEQLSTRPISTSTAVGICSLIRNADMQIRRVPGIALANPRTEQIVYTPPAGLDLLQRLLSNWEQFLHTKTEIDPLIRMAVGHYQFEAIHPFTDGNGRTGRILNVLFLVEQKLLRLPVLYLSRHVLRHRLDYYRKLQAVTTDGAWEDWIMFMLEAVQRTALWTTRKIQRIRDTHALTAHQIKAKQRSLYSRELVDSLFMQPYCRIQNLVNEGLGARQTVSAHLKALAALGLLTEMKFGREKPFLNHALLNALTAEEAGDE